MLCMKAVPLINDCEVAQDRDWAQRRQKSRWHAVIQKYKASDCGTRWLQGESRLFFCLSKCYKRNFTMTQLCRWRIDLALELSLDCDFLPRFCDMNGLQFRCDVVRMCKMCSPAGRESVSGWTVQRLRGLQERGSYFSTMPLQLLTACILLFFGPSLFQYFALSGTTFLSWVNANIPAMFLLWEVFDTKRKICSVDLWNGT